MGFPWDFPREIPWKPDTICVLLNQKKIMYDFLSNFWKREFFKINRFA
jgi:hypothetical protein